MGLASLGSIVVTNFKLLLLINAHLNLKLIDVVLDVLASHPIQLLLLLDILRWDLPTTLIMVTLLLLSNNLVCQMLTRLLLMSQTTDVVIVV